MNDTLNIGDYGYFQKGNRYFFKDGSKIHSNMGFKSKKECEEWISLKSKSHGFDWRVGFTIKFRSLPRSLTLVDKKGTEVKV